MSTSETVESDVSNCPCGNGKVVRSVTTQDNPWSGADVALFIRCAKCSSEWGLSHNTLTLKSSAIPYQQAVVKGSALYKEIEAFAAKIFRRDFEQKILKTKKAQLAYFVENSLTTMDYRRYLKHLSEGRQPWAACRWSSNIDWVLARCTSEERSVLNDLLGHYNAACQEREIASKQIVTRKVVEQYR